MVVWVLSGTAWVEERELGAGDNPWTGRVVTAEEFFLTTTPTPYELRWRVTAGGSDSKKSFLEPQKTPSVVTWSVPQTRRRREPSPRWLPRCPGDFPPRFGSTDPFRMVRAVSKLLSINFLSPGGFFAKRWFEPTPEQKR